MALSYSSLSEHNYILLVGEGDFSYASSVVKQTKAHIVATSLHSSLQTLTGRQNENILLLQKFGAEVYTDVDATVLSSHAKVAAHKYSIVVFNFPHIPGKMKINENRELLKFFFSSTKQVLADEGEVHVTLCKGQAGTEPESFRRAWNNTWKITAMAAISDFILNRMDFFLPENYPGYKCSGYRGLEKPFHIDGAMIHVFKLGHPVFEDLVSASSLNKSCNENLIASYRNVKMSYLNKCITCSRSIQSNLQHPVNQTLTSIMKEVMVNFGEISGISFTELLTCCGERSYDKKKPEILPIMTKKESFFTCPHIIIRNSYLNKIYNNLDDSVDVFAICGNVCCLVDLSFSNFTVNSNLLLFCKDKRYICDRIHLVLNAALMNQCSTSGFHNDYSIMPNILLNSPDIWKEIFINDENLGISEEELFDNHKIANILVNYKVLRSESYDLYHYKFITVCSTSSDCYNESQLSFKIGSVYKSILSHGNLFCLSLNIGYLSMLKYHIFDKRLLYSSLSYYESLVFEHKLYKIYRSPSLFPSKYIHDTSFWIPVDFNEHLLHLFLKNFRDVLLDLRIIDTYHDEKNRKDSRCYRFIYQSCDKPLSKEKVGVIHTEIVREMLTKQLSVILR